MKISKEYVVIEFNPQEIDGGFGPNVYAFDIATLDEAINMANGDENKVIYKQVVVD